MTFPNPGNGIFTLKSNLTTAKEVKIVISDLLGKTIMESSENINKGFERAYDLRHLDSGIYFITMTLDNSKQVIKLVIE